MHDLAPIGLSVYARLEHLQQTICALKNNYLAKKSMLYVFSDGPKVGDEDKVESVRAYLQTVTGFKDVVIIERDKNNRVFNNRDGQRMLIERYGKMIYIEEDVVTSPYFLMYMNDALDFYKDDERIFAITGFSPNTDYSSSYMSDVVLTKRMFAWAFAIWKDRYDLINMNINMKDYWLVRWSANKSKKYCIAGSDMLRQLRQVASGNIEALDTRINYTIFSRDMYLIAPRHSMIRSIGLDGSGEHWTSTWAVM